MKIISYNVNGIRSASTKGLADWLELQNSDIVCFQEIKAQEKDVPENFRAHSDYHSFWYPAVKKGYSGVGIMSKEKPLHVEYGCGIAKYDDEGRILRADYKDFSLISAYFPSGTTGDIRQDFKETFLDDFTGFIQDLKKQNKKLIITGDVNICHKAIDIHNPVSNKNSSGFLPQEREWFDRFLTQGYVDAFREINSNPHHYTWWSFRSGARQKNLGWRIDYHLVDVALQNKIENYRIHADVHMSDHCPIELTIKV
jgi:exodeoxyribonuclease III